MTRIDADGSGTIDQEEFTSLMALLMDKRDQECELRKVFRIFDDDDNGKITIENLWKSAAFLDIKVNQSEIEKMIEVADKKKKGWVSLNDFVNYMGQIGLIMDYSHIEEEEDKYAKLKGFKFT